MQNLYTIGQLKPLTESDILEVESLVPFGLPKDYKQFLSIYGLGDFNGLLMIQQPDEQFVKSNFEEFLYFWQLNEVEKQAVLNGLTIAATIDGDVVVLVDNEVNPYIILPRHHDYPIYLDSFENLINYYNKEYHFIDLYFDTNHNYELKYIQFDNVEEIHKLFLNVFSFDRQLNTKKQKIYIIQKMGGWVRFDEGAIKIKYQKQFQVEANTIIDYVHLYIK